MDVKTDIKIEFNLNKDYTTNFSFDKSKDNIIIAKRKIDTNDPDFPQIDEITISSSIFTDSETNISSGIKETTQHFNIPLLKSTLQKAVRLSNVEAAVNIAWQLLCQKPQEFLRRFPIIILEDAILHPQFPFLIWVMCAHSAKTKYILTPEIIKRLLCIVRDVAGTKVKDPIPMIDTKTNKMPESAYKTLDPFVTSIIIRRGYKGMAGDMEMLKKFMIAWYYRFYGEEVNTNEWNSEFKEVNSLGNTIYSNAQIEELINKAPIVKYEHRLRTGVDFHCYPNLISECRFPRYNGDTIKRAVWCHASSITNKTLICDPKLFKVINKGFNSMEEQREKEILSEVWNTIRETWKILTDPNKYWINEKKTKEEEEPEEQEIGKGMKRANNSNDNSRNVKQKNVVLEGGQRTIDSFFAIKKT